MSINRRTQTRFAVDLPAQMGVVGQAVTPHQLINLSLGGAQLAQLAGSKYAMGQRVSLTFSIPTQEEPITTEATVRWSSDKEVGVQFDGLRARDVYSLGKLFEQLTNA